MALPRAFTLNPFGIRKCTPILKGLGIHPAGPTSMLLRLAVSRRLFLVSCRSFAMDRMGIPRFFMPARGVVGFIELLGAIGAVELMTFAGNGKYGNGHKKDGE